MEQGARRMTLRSGHNTTRRGALKDISNKHAQGAAASKKPAAPTQQPQQHQQQHQQQPAPQRRGRRSGPNREPSAPPPAAEVPAKRAHEEAPTAAAAAAPPAKKAVAQAAAAALPPLQPPAPPVEVIAVDDDDLECSEEEVAPEDASEASTSEGGWEDKGEEQQEEEEQEEEEDKEAGKPEQKRKLHDMLEAAASSSKPVKRPKRAQSPPIAPEVDLAFLLPAIRPVHPVDKKDKDDSLAVVEYVDDIHEYLREVEAKSAPKPYMDSQKEINGKMRAILIDWIVEVHMKFKLSASTLYLTIHLIDRYCMANPVARTRLQLVGVACLLIASKYEEIYPPEVRECVYITDDAYNRDEVLKMEQKLLKYFHFHVTMPTVHHFLVRYLKVAQGSHMCTHRANYFAERAMQEHEVLKWSPSLIAASAVYLARKNETLDVWTSALIEYTGYTEDELLACATAMSGWVQTTTLTQSRRYLEAIKKKYTSSKHMEVSSQDHVRLSDD